MSDLIGRLRAMARSADYDMDEVDAATCREAISELERLYEIEWMYEEVCK